jgi:peptidoglycan/LPS O-acetylase OafA/YrhL
MYLAGWYLVQSTIIYTAGIKLYMHLTLSKEKSAVAATTACLFVCLPVTIIGGEIFHRLVDQPSQRLAHAVWEWLRS